MEAQPASENAQAVPSPVDHSGAGTPTGAERNTPTPGSLPQGLILPSMQDHTGAQTQQLVIPQQSLPMSVPGMPPGMAHMGGFMNQQQLMQMLDPSLQQNGGQQPPASQPSHPPPVAKPDPATLPKPPRKPLTPYMRFSKAIWQKVKNANPNMSVCEVGSTIGKMWREMGDTEKQKYNDEFLADKQKYDVELQEYLKVTGLTTADMMKKRDKKKESTKQPTVAQHLQMRNQMTQQSGGGNQQQIQMPPGQPGFPPQQQFMMGPGASSTLPHFSQVWAGQNFTPQQAQMFMMPGLLQQQQQQLLQQQGQALQNEQLQQQAAANGSQAGHMPAQMVVAQDGSQVLVGATNLAQQAVPAMFQAQEQPTTQNSGNSGSESTPTTLNQAVPQEARSQTPQQQQQQQQPQQPQQQQQAVVTQGAEGGNNPPGWPWHMVQHQLVTTQQQQVDANMAGSPAPQQNQEPPNTSANATDQNRGQAAPADPAGENSVPNGSDTPGVQESPNAVDMTVTQEGAQPESSGEKSTAQFNSAGAHYMFSAYGPQGPYGQPPPYNGRPVVSKESVMESELQHLRTALSEKTKEVQRLTQELEKAYETMDRMKQGERPPFNV